MLILRGYVGLFVIYSNEISDIRDAVRLCYKLASNSPCIIGHVIEENKRFVVVELDEYLKYREDVLRHMMVAKSED